MLPNAKNTLLAGLAALTMASTIAAPAQAWGKKEQGFVAGVATAVIVDQLVKNGKHRNNHAAPRYVQPHQPRYVEPRYVEPRYAEPRYVEPRYVEPRGRAVSVYATPAAKAFNSYSAAERRAIQRRLKASGYYYGGIDGAFGPGTYNAVQSYARAAGAPDYLSSTKGAFALYDGMLF